MKKRLLSAIVAAVVLIIAGWAVWNRVASPTKIALVNFQNFQVAKMAKSAENRWIKPERLSIGQFRRLKRYDAAIIFGMGIRMTDEHRAVLERLGAKGMPIYTTAATDPVNNINTLDSLQAVQVGAYLDGGGTKNYRSLFNYIRRELDGKKLFTGETEPPVEVAGDVLFHLDEDLSFTSVEEYRQYYEREGFYRPGAPKVAVVAGYAGPFDTNKEQLDSLIVSLEARGMNVYPISSVMKRMPFLQAVSPDAVVYMPHGRLLMGRGDRAVDWLKQQDIPVFCPITLNETYDNWMADKQGMVGGFMSQSVVMPELDGGIVPAALIAQYIDDDGLYLFKTIPGRLGQFTSTVANYLKLKTKANKDKKVAVYYFKGPGASAMVAAGLEVAPSLYNMLKHLRSEGYTVTGLPESASAFEKMLMERGPVFNSYAEGNIHRYLNSGYPAFVGASELDGWLRNTLMEEQYAELTNAYGAVPGEYYTRVKDGEAAVAVTRVEFGNVVLLPQPTQGVGENSFEAVHGANEVPPYHYIASYLWTRNAFKADAMIHFGTHGSLEFIPGKQVALSSADWADRMVNDIPHFYLYTVADIGEGVIAKRRSYATLVSHLNPPFIETGLRSEVRQLQDQIRSYLAVEDKDEKLNLRIKAAAMKMGLHRDLGLDSLAGQPYTDAEIEKIDNFAEELCGEKIMGGQYTLGEAFTADKIRSSVEMMAADPIAYSVAALDKLQGRVTQTQLDSKPFFNTRYHAPALAAVKRLLDNPGTDTESILRSLGVSKEDQARAAEIHERMQPRMNRMIAMMMAAAEKSDEPVKKTSGGGHPSWIPKIGKRPENTKTEEPKDEAAKPAGMPSGMPDGMGEEAPVTKDERDFANAVQAIGNTVANVNNYRRGLAESPRAELDAIVRGLAGGYIAPSPGGDFVANPNVVPSGRNMYSINEQATPSQSAWEKGADLGRKLLADYQKNHGGNYPAKVSFSLWSGAFIESEGTTIAQILWLLGVEPIRDQFGRVLDVRLVPEAELGRPRIDVVVQTSGQFRDLAASRLSLMQRAIDMAAGAGDSGENYVADGKNRAEQVLLEKGFSPKDARDLATTRIFGGINGMSGTGITGMIEAGDRWEDESEIAKVYLNNMGAAYGSEKSWGDFRAGVFEAALQSTNVVVQPRQSNTWGALSLDHVYEFMGGMNLTVRQVTGEEPDAYFNDLRNHYNVRVQDIRSAIGVESRSTIFNPVYIKEQMKGGASSANGFTEIVRNTYGWNVTKPTVIDNEMWDQIYDVYVQDDLGLGTQSFFEAQSPAALQEMTAIMLETARKGYWDATPEQLQATAELHSEMVRKHDAGCSGFTCDNAKLRDFIAQKLPAEQAAQYARQIDRAREAVISDTDGGVVLRKEEQRPAQQERTGFGLRTALIVFGAVALFIVLVFVVKRRRR